MCDQGTPPLQSEAEGEKKVSISSKRLSAEGMKCDGIILVQKSPLLSLNSILSFLYISWVEEVQKSEASAAGDQCGRKCNRGKLGSW